MTESKKRKAEINDLDITPTPEKKRKIEIDLGKMRNILEKESLDSNELRLQQEAKLLDLLKNSINALTREQVNEIVELFLLYGQNKSDKIYNLIQNDEWISSLTYTSAEEIASQLLTTIYDLDIEYDPENFEIKNNAAQHWQALLLAFLTRIFKLNNIISVNEKSELFSYMFEIGNGFKDVASSDAFLTFVKTWPKYIQSYNKDRRLMLYSNLKRFWNTDTSNKFKFFIVNQTKNTPESFTVFINDDT